MKKFKIAVVSVGLLLSFLIAGGWALSRYGNAVGAGKTPRRAVATVIKKEHVVLSEKRTVTFPNGHVMAYRDEDWYMYVRLDDFLDVGPIARDTIAKAERERYGKDGPYKIYIGEAEFKSIKEGDKTEVKYAYYPNAFWGVSDHIHVPW